MTDSRSRAILVGYANSQPLILRNKDEAVVIDPIPDATGRVGNVGDITPETPIKHILGPIQPDGSRLSIKAKTVGELMENPAGKELLSRCLASYGLRSSGFVSLFKSVDQNERYLLSTIKRAISSTDPWNRMDATKELVSLGGPLTLAALGEKVLADPNKLVRSEALKGLATLDLKGSLGLMKASSLKDNDMVETVDTLIKAAIKEGGLTQDEWDQTNPSQAYPKRRSTQEIRDLNSNFFRSNRSIKDGLLRAAKDRVFY